MLNGEIVQVDSHTATDTNFEKIVTFDAGGDKTFNNSIARQTWQKNRATVTAPSGGFVFSGADRLEDKMVQLIASNSTDEFAAVNIPNHSADKLTSGTVAPVRLPSATESAKGALETATTAEAKGLAATNKIMTPENVGEVLGDMLTTVVDIGVWDMDTDDTVGVAHSITLSKIRSIQAYIYNDGQTLLEELSGTGTTGDLGGMVITGSSATLRRTTGGRFDNGIYDDAVQNRGFLIIKHTP